MMSNACESEDSRTLSRRSVLQLGALGIASTMIPTAVSQGTTRNPLFIPPTVTASSLTLNCAIGPVDFGGGQMGTAWTYNGTLPGPTIIARKGDRASIKLVNNLTESTITHWHGLIVDHANDGGPHLAFDPGLSYQYSFPIVQRASFNFYHPHPHMRTGKQVNLGLAGGFIIRDAEEDALGLPSGPYEVPVVIRDANFDSAGNLLYNAASSGFSGKTPLVNGTLSPRLRVDRGTYRLRVLNGSNARVYRLALSNGAPFTLIGNDGGLLRAPIQVAQLVIAPGERLDVLVNFQNLAAGSTVILRCLDAPWNLLYCYGTGKTGVSYTPPQILSNILRLSGPNTPTRVFSFEGMSRINGQEYDMNRLDFIVPFGVVERWQFQTGGGAPHPIHVHGASFQVVSRTGGRGRLFPWERGWKDTVLLNDREVVDVLIRFDRYRGDYLLHCHKLEHEDMGMMANFAVQ